MATPPTPTPTPAHIPQELVMDILLRLPVKSLTRFQSVSKPWYSMIKSAHFIKRQANQTLNIYRDSMLKEFSGIPITYDPSFDKSENMDPCEAPTYGLDHRACGFMLCEVLMESYVGECEKREGMEQEEEEESDGEYDHGDVNEPFEDESDDEDDFVFDSDYNSDEEYEDEDEEEEEEEEGEEEEEEEEEEEGEVQEEDELEPPTQEPEPPTKESEPPVQ